MESYYNRHRDRIKLNNQIYKLMNIEKVILQNKLYKDIHYDRLHEPYVCECGGCYTYNSRAKHFKTKKHIKFLQTEVSALESPSQSE